MASPEGLRDRKRRLTRQRVVDAGLELFLKQGFDATTIDQLAAAADISRRTFFHYFPSKEDVVMAWQEGAAGALRAAVTANAPGRRPLDAVEAALNSLVPVFETHNFVVLDGLMRATETLRAKKQGHYEQQERGLFALLTELWPDPGRRAALETVAMAGIGCLRLATENWLAASGTVSMRECLDAAFGALRGELRA